MATTVTFTYGANALTITGDGVYEGPTYDRLEGWYGVDVDVRFQPRPSAAGSFAPQQAYARDRVISLEGQYFGADRADAIAMRERLLGLQNDGRPLTMTVADDLRTTSREVYVEQITVPWTIHQEFRYAIDVRAADPRRYAPGVESTTGPAVSAGGLSLPLALPVDFGIAGDDGRLTAVNVGNTATGQRFTVSGGGMPDGFDIVNTTTGQRIRYLGPVSSELIGTELIATNLATNPSFETGSGTVEVRRNLHRNPSLETNTTNWAALDAGFTQTRETTTGFSGTAFARYTRTGATGTVAGGTQIGGSGLTTAASAVLSAATQYTMSIYVRPNVDRTLRASANWRQADGTNIGSADGSSVLCPANVWTRLSVTATSPALTGLGGVRIVAGLSETWTQTTDYVDADAALVEASPTLNPYFDGSTSAGGDFTYAWTGTANASASVQNAVGVARLSPSTGAMAGSDAVVFQSGEWASTGTKSLRVRPSSASNASFINLSSTGAGAISVTPGAIYTAIAKVRLTAPQTGTLNANARTIAARFFQGSEWLFSTPAPNTVGIHEVRFTFTVPASRTQLNLQLINGASAGNGDVWWDDFMLVEGTYTGDYFDGATVDTYRTVYSWSGAPDASTSTATRQIYSESFIVIDSRLRTALINGTAPAARFLASPEWWEVPAGSSVDIQFVPRGPTTGSPILTAETASAFY